MGHLPKIDETWIKVFPEHVIIKEMQKYINMSILEHMLYPHLDVLMLAMAMFGIRNESNNCVINNK